MFPNLKTNASLSAVGRLLRMLPIVQALQGEEFPDIPHRQLQILHVRQLPEAARYLHQNKQVNNG